MHKINQTARKASDLLASITVIPLMIMGGVMVLVVVAGTFWRYALNNPLLWTEEVARYLMVWVALIGASIALKHREHVRICIILERLPFFLRQTLTLVTNIFIAYFLFILVKEGWQMTLRGRFQISPALGISMFWPLLSVPLMGIFTMAQLILQMIIDFTGGEG